MNTRELIALLRQRGVQLTVDDGRLKYQAPRGVITEELLALLKECRA